MWLIPSSGHPITVARGLSTTLVVAGALAASACTSAVRVRTQAAPDAALAGRQTFRILPVPPRRGDAASARSDDPMLANSITNQALVGDLTRAFEARGYTPSADSAAFSVAYYTSAREKLDIANWDYGYPNGGYGWGRRGWRGPRFGPSPYPTVTQYTQGTVVVDVIDPATKKLLWRGEGVSDVSDDPATYAKELNKAVTAVVSKFPAVAPAASASNGPR
jgi:hypothetical protein